jgi:hypothetical protein
VLEAVGSERWRHAEKGRIEETPGVEAVWGRCAHLSKTSGMHIKSFVTHYGHLSVFIVLVVYPCFAFKNYTCTSKFPCRALARLHSDE